MTQNKKRENKKEEQKDLGQNGLDLSSNKKKKKKIQEPLIKYKFDELNKMDDYDLFKLYRKSLVDIHTKNLIYQILGLRGFPVGDF